jgi:hypothetical protein
MFLPAGIWAAEKDGPLPLVKFRRSKPEQVYALYYDCPLEGLGLQPGWQRTSEDAPLLPAPAQVFEATLGEGLSWSPLDTVPEDLAAVRLETTFGCAQFAVRPVVLEGEPGTGARVLADAGEGRYLFASLAGKFFLVTREGAMQIDTPTTTPHAGSYTDEDGVVWLLGTGGRLAKYRPETGFEDAGTTASRSGSGDTGDLDGLGSELFAVSNEGVVDRFDGSGWEVIVGDPDDCHDSPGIAVLAPGHAIAIGPRDGSAVRYRDGAISDEVIIGAPTEGLNSIAYGEEVGAVIGTSRGEYWIHRGGWSRVPDSPTVSPARALAPFGSGFLSGTINGFVTQWHPQIGFCMAAQLASNGVHQILPSPTGIVVSAIHEEHQGDQADVVTFVDALGGTSCGR